MKSKTPTHRDLLDREQWGRLKNIVADALEQPSAAARAEFVAARCANDAALLSEAASLLEEAEQFIADPTDVLEECADHATARLWQDEPPRTGWRIGAYSVKRELGRGGMGTVYLAARADGQFDKEVAIKVLKRGMDTDELLRRFAAERHILARLDHPNIARLLDAGTTEDGLPYFVMEYVAGSPVTRFVRDHQLSIHQRLALFLKICAAVEVAHRNHIIHRDLKPTNILVTADGDPKLLDFGIAKLLTPGDDCLDLTAAGEQRLTPTCASPEQADGQPTTAATDVYALGALLYEMLSGQKPHRFQNAHPSREEIARVIRDQEPPAPSSVSGPEAARQLRGDLDAIVLYALRKQPECRYATAADFASDVSRHLSHQPVLARRHNARYRMKCLVARHRSRVRLVAIASAVVLSVGAAIALWGRYLPASHSSAAGQSGPADLPKSIAVLPFDHFGDNAGSSYFSDGVQDNILTDLGKIGDLKVVSRSAVAALRGQERNVREIGRRLGVSNVLEGSVQISGDHVRINAQLIDTRTDTQVWADHYDRKIEDIFALQSELAQTIATQLNAKLSSRERAAIWKRPTEDMQAYDLFLRARAEMNESRGTEPREGWQKAVELASAATSRDTKFTLAFCLLNEAHLYMYRYGSDHSPEHLAAAKEAADTALRLEPNSEDARIAVARYFYFGLADYQRTQQELALIPAGAHPVWFYTLAALVERRLGLWDETVQNGLKAVELDPQDPSLAFNVIQTLTGLKRYRQSESVANAAILRLPPTAATRLWTLKNELEVARGNIAGARAALEAAPSGRREMDYQLAQLSLAMLDRNFSEIEETIARDATGAVQESSSYWLAIGTAARAANQVERARSAFEQTRRRAWAGLEKMPDDPMLLSELGVAAAGLGLKQEALRDARRAVEMRPISKDAVTGPMFSSMLAQTFAWIGDRDSALDLLEELAKLPFGPSYGDLKLSPAWDDLRDDRRFGAILKESESLAAAGSQETAPGDKR